MRLAIIALLLLAIPLAHAACGDNSYGGVCVIGGAISALPTGNYNQLAEAIKYLGVLPYIAGGNSLTRGADCSGFTQAVFRRAGGITLPRTAAEQYGVGTPVDDESQLLPGDLVFFKNTYKTGISHVGIYAGNCEFIDSPKTGSTVSKENMCVGYWAAHYAGARRV